ncbi:cytochrome bd-I ubiquinol oxidase subunit 2 [Variibacter gotjawalensis]|uniref:Cytochrome bd-I ubiquinol oxidase subunit 2 n=1 Tax=Variibacter gotjawalensis TaxID=1333996 RepID=A0A0S3PSV3_9BRAD|nr:cytochrome d ubiquinol oxidase subunit II [Variibacter gotjawalensis]NIK49359.1 cytochrome d ubiquinol oxidase subunit II [Variibacter gotjawalensis]RZS51210.1 cytochrome bd-I ubiquinol oxidase subunit 2 apoprotein [Variibacter gotjawalensis]BAT59045.1 cytochrome bd-I ubiquinol oxidase subunit 2 [Variibacter gotjawalensis]
MEWYLPVIWAGLIGTAVALYVILDGFDLGVAILFPFTENEGERHQMTRSIAPFWDGNETWLVLGGAGLFVAFPKAYSIIMPAFYLPVIVMLLALVFRGVAFEFRIVAHTSVRWWNVAFFGGSLTAALAQGVILGGMIQGIKVENGAFAGGAFDWATPFSLLCGLGLASGYALLGATWLILKTEGQVAIRARRQALIALMLVLGFMGAVSLYTPFLLDRIATRWFTTPNIYFLWPVPLVTGFVALMLWRWLDQGRELLPFLATIALFLLGYLGLVISSYPYLVPPTLTVWDVAAHPSSQIFMLLGTLVLLPIVLGYLVLVFWVFRGKVREGEAYH